MMLLQFAGTFHGHRHTIGPFTELQFSPKFPSSKPIPSQVNAWDAGEEVLKRKGKPVTLTT